ncbi:MAG: phenylalanine--tRNA ligase subunit beta [Methanotrichaceae archaeon]
MPVIRLYYEDLETLVGADRDLILERVPMLGADIERLEDEYADVEFFPDRPDLYSPEGVARAMRGFLEIESGLPLYDITPGQIEIEIDDSVKDVRPYLGSAVVRGLEFTDPAIESLMDLQEDLHWGLGRNRRKVAIGVHDISRVTPPFRYLAENPDRKFVPLDFTESLSMKAILKQHPKGIGYGHILKEFDRYPLIVDADDQVLSFPPIINGDLTRVRDDTHDLFLDVTGTDFNMVQKTLNIVATALAERGGQIESVLVKSSEGQRTLPNLTPARWIIKTEDANCLIGTSLATEEIAINLEKMRFGARTEASQVEVLVPAYRADIMHFWDIFEDVAIGYGYENLDPEMPRTVTIGESHPIEARKSELRDIMVGLGYIETMPFTLTNENANFSYMRRSDQGSTKVLHPISELHTMVRTTILPCLLEIFSINQHHSLPQQIFAVGDVLVDKKTKQNLAAASIHSSANFAEIRSVVDALFKELSIEPEIVVSEDGAFLEGRGADLIVGGLKVGSFGEVHPQVLHNFGLEQPVVGMELRWKGLQKDL